MPKSKTPTWTYDVLGGIAVPRGVMREEPFIDEFIARSHLEDVRAGNLSENVRELLNMVEPGWEVRGELYGLEVAERELSELQLACWLECQREAASKGLLTEDQLRVLDDGTPGWREHEGTTKR